MPKRIKVVVGGAETPRRQRLSKPSAVETSLAMSLNGRAFHRLATKHLKPFKLDVMHWLLLGLIETRDKGGVSLGVAARMLDVTMSQMTALSSSLVEARLLRTKTLRADRRSRRLLMTAKGRLVLSKATSAMDEVLAEWFKPVPDNYLSFYHRANNLLSGARPGAK